MIAAMDETGFCQFASVANVARRANVDITSAAQAIHVLEGPDADSSDPENEGRRLEKVPGGWIVLNAEKYRAIVTRASSQESNRRRVAKHRASKKGMSATDGGNDLEKRFFDKFEKTDGCWEWTGYINRGGYGVLEFGGSKGAHRISYEIHSGKAIPDGLHVDHLCQNRKCVNPAHLELVTTGENTRRGWKSRTVTECNKLSQSVTPSEAYTETEAFKTPPRKYDFS